MKKTRKKKNIQVDELHKIRHSCEHVLTMAMLRIWGNKIKAVMGPATDDGFYFDFDSEIKISEENFPRIEKEMAKIIKDDLPIIRDELNLNDARNFFNKNIYKGNEYKHDWLDAIKTRGEKVGVYWMGKKNKDMPDTFVDICAGPHAKSTGKIGAFKLLNVAGAYWHGDEKNKMLQRIYGIAFQTKDELEKHIHFLEEAKKRDHRKLGAELELFTFADEIGQGLPLWLPKGTIIREELEKWAKFTEEQWGYVRVATPHIAKHILYEISGHLPYYKDDMYSPMKIDDDDYYLKGMNCPHHHMIYKSKPRSYRELPLRLAEYGTVYRYEQSGALFGLMRVRCISQNDAHIYCTEEQAEQEFLDVLKLHEYYYNTLGLTRNDYHIVVGLPDPKNWEKYHGDKALWNKAEKMMRKAIKKTKIRCIDDIGGAAFYGPKIDFNITSSIGRIFGVSTCQLDLYMPTRFHLEYTDTDGQKKLAAVIHRAPLGSHERFIGFLIEHYAGAFPLWLSSVQVKLLPVAERHNEFVETLHKEFMHQGIRSEIDDSKETVGNKIRKAITQKSPYILVCGDKETKGMSLSVRERGKKDTFIVPRSQFIDRLKREIAGKK